MTDIINKLHAMIMGRLDNRDLVEADTKYRDMVEGVIKTENMIVIPPYDNGMMGFVPVVVYVQGDRVGVINPNVADADRTFELDQFDDILSAALDT